MALNEATSWAVLRDLRAGGKKPSMPLIVTTKRHLPARLEGVGAMVILHTAGEVLPVNLLAGLEVIFMLERCDLASKIWRLAQGKGVTFNAKVWCPCAGSLNVMPYTCESYQAMVDWAERTHVAA